ncbi:hypothetical protein AB0M46_11915 [Dactylosporangium sp. NPDC051485]|uniref:hypothetical protein n=1 Tax=Dactylosporangium sp. NPDC051485 TaxID=3154846 RepID=UPI0034387325
MTRQGNDVTVPAAPAQPWQEWIGRTEVVDEVLDLSRARNLAATLDLDLDLGPGDPLPPGWHWLYFNPFVRRGELGVDGHPRRGGFLPPVELPRRMWAGSDVHYRAPLPAGAAGRRHSEIVQVRSTSGRSGDLVFVKVRHTIECEGVLRIEEVQDIVYRGHQVTAGAAPAADDAGAPDRDAVVPDPTMLFRYSALTSNGHRIHYDRTYATAEEGYPDLVVHGPLTATLLQLFARGRRPDARLEQFTFRGVAPLFVDRPIVLGVDAAEPPSLTVVARNAAGATCMEAVARFGI